MFILCSVTVNGTACSTLASKSFDAGVERLLLGAAGNYQAEIVALMRQVPRVRFSTRKINLFTDVALGSGAAIFRSVTEGGVGGSSYISLTGTNNYTLSVPRRITWQQGGPAILEGEMFFLSSDGAAAPITVGATTGDLTAETALWSGDTDQVYSISIDFGYDIALPADGKLYQKHVFVRAQRPVITIGTYASTDITTAKVNPGSITSLTAVLAAIADGGVRGTTASYAVTGHCVTSAIEGAKPGTVMVSCAGKGGITIS